MGSLGSFQIFYGLFNCSRETGVHKVNGKLQHIFIPSKTPNLDPEFAVEVLSLDRNAAFVPGFAVKDLPLGRILMIMTIKIYHEKSIY